MTQLEAAKLVMQAYEIATFDCMFPHMEESYRHISFWVTEVLRGKANAVDYYIGKGNAVRSSSSLPAVKLVRISEAPDKVRPNGLFRGGVQMLEDPVFLHRQDAGKVAVLMKQYSDHDGKDIFCLAIPSVSEKGLLQETLITDPKFYKLEEFLEA